MGLWDEAEKAFNNTKKAAQNTVSGLLTPANNSIGRALTPLIPFPLTSTPLNVISRLFPDDPPDQPREPTPEEIYRRQMQEKQYQMANDFEAGLPQYRQKLAQRLSQQAYGKLGQGTQNVRAAANRRGLLKSGIREAQEGALRGQVAAEQAGAYESGVRQLESVPQKLRSAAVQGSLELLQDQQAMEDAIYNQAFSQFNDRMSNIGSLFGAAGSIGGLAIAKGRG